MDSENEIEIVTTDSVCRTCLETITGKSYPLSGELVFDSGIDVASMLEFCAFSKLNITEDLPNKVCISCFKTIRITYRFLKKFYESQTKLIELQEIERGREREKERQIQKHQIENELEKVQLDYTLVGKAIIINEVHLNGNESTYDQTINKNTTENIKSEVKNESENGYEANIFYTESGDSCVELQLKTGKNTLDTENHLDNQPFADQNEIEIAVNEIVRANPKIEIVVEKSFKLGANNMYYLCPLCDKKFSKSYVFFSHVENHQLPRIKCNRCPTEPELDLHEYFTHYMHLHKYQCDVCNKALSTSFGYKYHMELHNSSKKTKCPIEGCRRTFMIEAMLNRHIKGHYKKSVYPCHLCDQTFQNNDNLKYHLKLHSGKRDHLCSVCGQAFFQAVTLRDHMYRHLGYKSFVCDICGKGFVNNGGLKKHNKYCSSYMANILTKQ